MSLDGQGDTAPEPMDDLVNFLSDNPQADEFEEDEEAKTDDAEEASDDSPAEDDEESSDDEAEQPSGRKHKVTVKGEDGADQLIEVDDKELIAGYTRHADYTRKTQELGNKEREITQVLSTRYQEMQSHYTQQAQMTRQAIVQLAGLKSSDDMAMLAQTDPGAWVAEQQRSSAIQGMLSQIDQGLQQEQAQRNQQLEQQRNAMFQQSWQTLKAEGFDRPKLESLYEKATKTYSFSKDELATVMDAKQIMVLRDAIAYQELKSKRAEVTKKVEKAPPLPAQRQSVPKNQQQLKSMNARFSSGKAKLSDLAAFLEKS